MAAGAKRVSHQAVEWKKAASFFGIRNPSVVSLSPSPLAYRLSGQLSAHKPNTMKGFAFHRSAASNLPGAFSTVFHRSVVILPNIFGLSVFGVTATPKTALPRSQWCRLRGCQARYFNCSGVLPFVEILLRFSIGGASVSARLTRLLGLDSI